MFHVTGSTDLADLDWECLWAPYDQATYQCVLDAIKPSDIVLEIGAGDLRLARQIAAKAGHGYAIEIQAWLIDQATFGPGGQLPAALEVIVGDALQVEFPKGITAGVLLMRHCTHFREYIEKLSRAGCQRLITNARWGMGVECIDVGMPRQKYNQVEMGWYACWCGKVGFKPGPAEWIDSVIAENVHEVIDCPSCLADSRPLRMPDGTIG